MARVPYVRADDLEEPARSVLASYTVNLFEALANAPRGLGHLHGIGMWIRNELSLPARLRELAILQVGACARSEYEFSHHVGIGLEHGLRPEDVRAVLDRSERSRAVLSDLERTTLEAASQLADDGAIDDDTWDALRGELDDQQLVELVVTISFYCGVVRMLSALRVDVEERHQDHLREFPFPG